MCYYIGIEDLAANALIALLKSDRNKRFISYSDIERYGAMVLHVLDQRGKKAVLILSRDNTNALFRNYSDYFDEGIQNERKGIALRQDKTVEDLIDAFCGYLPLQLLLAFIDKSSISVLEGCA